MKIPSLKEATLEYVLISLFLIFIVFQIEIPLFLAEMIDTPIGISTIIIFSFYIFLYTTPILGVITLIAAYELLRRSSLRTGKYAIPLYIPSQEKRDNKLESMNEPIVQSQMNTLEEEIISNMSPIGVSNKPLTLIETSFQPINENTHNATLV